MFAWRRVALHRRVIVNTKAGTALRGYVMVTRGPLLVLKDAELLEAGREPVAITGEVVLERANLDFTQVLPAAEG